MFVTGTNLGAALVDLETGIASWVCRSKSDVFAQQIVHSVMYESFEVHWIGVWFLWVHHTHMLMPDSIKNEDKNGNWMKYKG